MLVRIRHPEKLIYPESDGQPMGENTIQVKWIITLYNGLEAVFRDRPDVFVAANLFWYPVHGDPTYSLAPDVMVALGRPKGDRPSYKQWEEGNVAPQVVFEVLSPSNTTEERDKKLEFYRRNGVEEFYEYDPYNHVLQLWQRSRKKLVPVGEVDDVVSPRLGVRFVVPEDGPMTVFGPDGKPFRSYLELLAEAEVQQRRADEATERAAALAARLRELGVDPDRV
jgi:Uma2 family endonuclease